MKKSFAAALAAVALTSAFTATTPAFAADPTPTVPATGLMPATKAEKLAMVKTTLDDAMVAAKNVYNLSMQTAQADYNVVASSAKRINGRLVVRDLAPALKVRKAAETAARTKYNTDTRAAWNVYTKAVAAIRAGK